MIMVDSPAEPGVGATRTAMPDLRNLRLSDLLRSKNAHVAAAARRVRADSEQSAESYTAFGNAP
jgi:hypothetical protein